MKKHESEVFIIKDIDGFTPGRISYWTNEPTSMNYIVIGKGTVIGEIEDDTRDKEIQALEKDLERKTALFSAAKSEILERIDKLKAIEHKNDE